MCASGLPGDCHNLAKVRFSIHRTSVFSVGQRRVIRWRKNEVMTMRDNQLGMCASGLPSDCSNLVKVRLSDGSDGSDGSIGKRVFRQTKNCRIEKLTSTTVVSTSVGNLTLAMALTNQFVATRNCLC